jgi:hypothetical protein
MVIYNPKGKKMNVDGGQGEGTFCLAKAPDKEVRGAVHHEAHGLKADEIFEVKEGEETP